MSKRRTNLQVAMIRPHNRARLSYLFPGRNKTREGKAIISDEGSFPRIIGQRKVANCTSTYSNLRSLLFRSFDDPLRRRRDPFNAEVRRALFERIIAILSHKTPRMTPHRILDQHSASGTRGANLFYNRSYTPAVHFRRNLAPVSINYFDYNIILVGERREY